MKEKEEIELIKSWAKDHGLRVDVDRLSEKEESWFVELIGLKNAPIFSLCRERDYVRYGAFYEFEDEAPSYLLIFKKLKETPFTFVEGNDAGNAIKLEGDMKHEALTPKALSKLIDAIEGNVFLEYMEKTSLKKWAPFQAQGSTRDQVLAYFQAHGDGRLNAISLALDISIRSARRWAKELLSENLICPDVDYEFVYVGEPK